MIETIKEYLISLGFKTDNSSLNAAQQAMKKAEDSVTGFSDISVKNFAKAAVGVVSFVATANLALGKFIATLAQTDLQTEMLAARLWMSKDAAKAYQSSIDALGVSIDDLYLSPELMNKYLELNRQAREMAVPTDEYRKQMQSVRDITFQFQRLKLEGTYALQWIGYYLTKYLEGPMGNVKDWLTEINDKIQENMPQWTKRVAEVTSWVVRLAKAAWSIRDALGAAAGAFTAISLIKMASNPFGAFVLGLTALLLLVDDFNTYMSGGESAFPKLWEWVEKFKKSLVDNGTIKDFKDMLKSIVQGAKELKNWLEKVGQSEGFKKFLSDSKDLVILLWHGIQNTWNWLVDLWKQLNDTGTLGSFGQSILNVYSSVVLLFDALGDLLNALGGEGGFDDLLSSVIINSLTTFRDMLNSIAALISIIAAGIKGITTGDWSGMGKGYEGLKKALIPDEGLRKKAEEYDKNSPLGKAASGILDSIFDLFTKKSLGDGFSNALKKSQDSPWSKFIEGFTAKTAAGASSSGIGYNSNYLQPQTNTSNMTQITMKPVYNIYGAKDSQSVATTIGRTSTAMITRMSQGVNR
ncbi:MAG TPA: hypothetical protein VN456_04745 [Desulfosporosinus sp.]|nr:hypothetical protein [Desulfosporosinus sp.]